MDMKDARIQKAFDWLGKENGENFLLPDEHCPTRDVFQGRLEKMNILLKNAHELNDIASLIVVIVGEIGNNAFDHNLGNWRDEVGVYFSYDITARCIVIADRGLGVQTTLKRVRPEIQNDCEALTIAFKEIVTSRAPEKRGNGLKLVEKMVLAQNMKLDVYSGAGHYGIEHGETMCSGEEKVYNGVIAVLKF
ncbi:hypothetical protein HY732_00170 [Candidatus Uhrbacteria bacterium]|nr:hypothetical protein [Candidatus Uhrbacteria bacterium]